MAISLENLYEDTKALKVNQVRNQLLGENYSLRTALFRVNRLP